MIFSPFDQEAIESREKKISAVMIVFVNLFKSISFMLRKKIKHRKLTEKNGRLQKLEDCFELKREHVSKKKQRTKYIDK